MTNQEKFIQIFGITTWQAMIVFSGLAEQFKEYWTSPYKAVEQEDILNKLRDEVKAISNVNPSSWFRYYHDSIDRGDVLRIIDEYRESEG